MTWAELRDYVERQIQLVQPGEQARIDNIQQSTEPAGERRARRLAGEYAARSVVDSACRQYAEKQKWPAMDADASLYAHDRWIWMIWFSRWLDETGTLREEHSRKEWLHWLLVESWHELGSWRRREGQRSPDAR